MPGPFELYIYITPLLSEYKSVCLQYNHSRSITVAARFISVTWLTVVRI